MVLMTQRQQMAVRPPPACGTDWWPAAAEQMICALPLQNAYLAGRHSYSALGVSGKDGIGMAGLRGGVIGGG
jgi:hypothetical protein